MIYVDREEKTKLKGDIFRECEIHDGIPRIVERVERNVPLHPRIIKLCPLCFFWFCKSCFFHISIYFLFSRRLDFFIINIKIKKRKRYKF